ELPVGSIDLVFMCDAYHHVEQPAAYLASLRAALKADGRLVIVDYRRGPEGTWRYGHIRATPAEFRAEIEAAGFTLDREVELLEDNFFFVFRPAPA
ncbi:MAG: methyltransferase domain-containing protein, partial [Myxococcota bacterium]